MTNNPYLNALLAAAYIALVACVMYFGTSTMAGKEDTVLAPIAMLSLFVLSAAVMGFIFLFQPLQLLVKGDVASATTLFLKTLVTFAAITAVVFAALITFSPRSETFSTPTGKLMSVESYVSRNISNLSPEKEVLGGTFYVTDINVADGKGVVQYEDGHNAYIADFTYEAADGTGIRINSFVVRK